MQKYLSMKTKKSLAAALKRAMENKSLSKITVSELIAECNVNRKTFYYHYRDIYDLLESMLAEELHKFDAAHFENETLEECIFKIASFIIENKKAVKHIYDSVDRDKLEQALYEAALPQITHYVKHNTGDAPHTENDIKLLSSLYSAAFAGAVLHMLKSGIPDTYDDTLRRICSMFDGSVEFALKNLNKTTKSE